MLDLFALDGGMVTLRSRIDALPRPVQAEGILSTFGGQQAVQLLTTEQARGRCQAWLTMRDEIGLPLGLEVTFN